ncbi:SPFH domain-containing protein [Butyrivibrio sp. AC2005]|uniref:SPFH domain-containing protein n=1 Tax=Butyrivibrio sp. AC2005 TaxID=1280672 RepID=UPI0003FFCE3F|nr:SPFH domain-containing protein [Butyrivibrio sp. AC2005]
MGIFPIIQHQDRHPDLIMFRHPIDRVPSHTEIRVGANQEAITYEGGTACLHTYGTEPILHGMDIDAFLLDAISVLKNEGTFDCESYFVETTYVDDAEWGVDDIVYNHICHPSSVPYHFGLSGTVRIEIEDTSKSISFFRGQKYMTRWMLNEASTLFIAETIRANIAQIIKGNHFDIYYIEDYLPKLTNLLREIIEVTENRLGLRFSNFSIKHIQKVSDWSRPPMDNFSPDIVGMFHGLTPSEKKTFLEQFSQILTTTEDIRIFKEVTEQIERR